jgi:hypothetical protein
MEPENLQLEISWLPGITTERAGTNPFISTGVLSYINDFCRCSQTYVSTKDSFLYAFNNDTRPINTVFNNYWCSL